MYKLVLNAEEVWEFIEKEFPNALRFPHRIERVEPGRVVSRWLYKESALRPGGTISGPTQFTLVDATMFYLVLAHVGREALAFTTDASLHFLRRPKPKDLLCDARLLKLGKRLVVGDLKVYSEGEEDAPVMAATLTYSIP